MNPAAAFEADVRALDRHEPWRVFSDFCEAGAIALTNPLEKGREWYQAREARYVRVLERYGPKERPIFLGLIRHVIQGLGEDPLNPVDFLGGVFQSMSLANKWKGQFFTPMEICRMMARMTIGSREDVAAIIAERGYVRAMEPASGSGATILALAAELRAHGYEPARRLFVVAVDNDATAAHMSTIQLALTAVPAAVCEGNSLSVEAPREVYRTPMYWMGAPPGVRWHGRPGSGLLEAATVVKRDEEVKPIDSPAGQLSLF
jgi:hypothetical protein